MRDLFESLERRLFGRHYVLVNTDTDEGVIVQRLAPREVKRLNRWYAEKRCHYVYEELQ